MEKGKPQNTAGTGKPARDSKGRFIKGNSGNPGGRPKLPEEIRDYADKSVDELWKIATDSETPEQVRARIFQFFIEMGYGKPSQRVETDQNITTAAETTIKFEGVLDEWSK